MDPTRIKLTHTINFALSDRVILDDLGQRLAELRKEDLFDGQGHDKHRSELVRFAVRKLAEHQEEWLPELAEQPA